MEMQASLGRSSNRSTASGLVVTYMPHTHMLHGMCMYMLHGMCMCMCMCMYMYVYSSAVQLHMSIELYGYSTCATCNIMYMRCVHVHDTECAHVTLS